MPPIAGARAERDVHRAEDLLVLEDVAGQRRRVVRADAELGEVRPAVAVRVEQLEQPLAPRAGASARRPSSTVSVAGSSASPIAGEADATTVPSPPAGAMKPSPHGRLPNAPRRGEVAVVGDAVAAA